MKSVSIKKSTKIKFHLFLALFVILWINSGTFSYISIYLPDSFKMFIFFIWFFIACVRKKNYLINYLWNSKFLLIFFLILLITNRYTTSVYLTYYIKTTMFLLAIYSILRYYYDFRFDDEKKIIVNFLIIDYIYVGVNTVIKLQQNPGLSRYLSMSEENIIKILGLGSDAFLAVGNYTFAYSMVFVGLFCVYKIIYARSNKFILGYFAILYLIINMQFTIALFLLLIFTAILIFTKVNKNSYVMVINTIFVLIMLSILLIFLPDLLIYLSPFMPDRMQSKFIELAHFLLGISIEGTDFNLRLELYIKSINVFLNNIFIGALSEYGEIGGHSTWFDFLGQFGLISLPIFIFFIKAYKNIIKQCSKKSLIYVRISFLYILFLGLINTIYSPRILLTLFIFVPFVARIYGEKGLDEEKLMR